MTAKKNKYEITLKGDNLVVHSLEPLYQVNSNGKKIEMEGNGLPSKVQETEGTDIGYPTNNIRARLRSLPIDGDKVVNSLTESSSISNAFCFTDRMMPIYYEEKKTRKNIAKFKGEDVVIKNYNILNWTGKLRVVIDESILSLEHFIVLLNRIGSFLGFGRFSKRIGGQYGSFKVLEIALLY